MSEPSIFEDLVTLREVVGRLERAAFAILPEYAALKGANTKYLTEITSMWDSCYPCGDPEVGEITFEGDEYWRYGGHEHYRLTMPVRFLYDSDYREELKAKREEDLKLATEKNAEYDRVKRAQEIQQLRAQLQRLERTEGQNASE